MLGVKNYTQAYIDDCRSRVEADVAAYDRVAEALRVRTGGFETADGGLADFEARFFNNMVVLLDACFVHRLRTLEGKDGNPLNEVRLLCDSILTAGGAFTPEKAIKYAPSKSILGYEAGQEVRVSRA